MSHNISRRGFLKGAVVGALGLGAVALSGCSASDGQSAKSIFKAGEYTSTQSTGFAKVDIKCTFSATELTAVSYEVTESSDSDFFSTFENELKDYCKNIEKTGNAIDVDGVAGATLSSNAVKNGVLDCAAQALGIELDSKSAVSTINAQDDDFHQNSIKDWSKSQIFSSWKLGNRTFSHRMVKSAAFQLAFMANITDEFVGYYERMAKGGVEMIWIEDFAGMWEFNYSPLRPNYEDVDVKALTSKLHEYGCTIGWQWGTMGSEAGPLEYTAPFIGKYPTSKVKEWIKTIGDIAERLQKDGFDAFELNMAANNLGQSFFSRQRNDRTDEYGAQNMDNRCRFCVEAIQEIKSRCGKDFIVQVLINGDEQDDKTFDNTGLTTLGETIEIAKRIEAAGADSLHVRICPQYTHLCQFAPDLYFVGRGLEGYCGIGGNRMDFSKHFDGRLNATHHGYGIFLDVAAEIKKHVSIPVGTPCNNDPAIAPDMFENAIKEGKVDFLIMNRSLCVDPEYVNKLREGRLDEIAPCTKCLHCFYDADRKGQTIEHCRVNAANWRAYHATMPEGFEPTPVKEVKNIMVIGGGPAGMEAARIAAQRGHNVTLYEKEESLGGLLSFAEGVKGKHENLGRLRDYLIRQQEVKGVKVVTGKEVDAAFVKEQNPDAVILAIGGLRDKLSFKETDKTKIVALEDVLGASMGHEVTVYGSNAQAVDTAIYLNATGHKVTIVTPDKMADFEKGHSVNVIGFIKPALLANGVRVIAESSIKSVNDGSITIDNAGYDEEIACDALVEGMDMLPNKSMMDELKDYTVIPVGDCDDPFNISEAISSGNIAARNI